MVEHSTADREVPGSNPGAPLKFRLSGASNYVSPRQFTSSLLDVLSTVVFDCNLQQSMKKGMMQFQTNVVTRIDPKNTNPESPYKSLPL